MGKRKRIRWSANLAYAVGLITSDGCLSKDGRHIDLTSKDLEQIQNFKRILKLKNKIGLKSSGSSNRKYFDIQFGNVKLYRWLVSIGLTHHKSKTLGPLEIPDKFFIDFLRRCLDGDGCVRTYWDAVFSKSYRLYTYFFSASYSYIKWLNAKIANFYGVTGKISYSGREYRLVYAKYASLVLLKEIYYNKNIPYLSRKYSKFTSVLDIISKQAGVEKLVDSLD